ncbi:hypothetical protein AVEN_34957-1 [Araneus ventricosus]|uniref:Uncharacterized protein n=1 Tax=Araneus ventricosus TaxID=182803 RepID=A0A4Y2MX60_ARAVE|nr:hypothetical protein AVEN_34957-1 [Araneus ventricosus]
MCCSCMAIHQGERVIQGSLWPVLLRKSGAERQARSCQSDGGKYRVWGALVLETAFPYRVPCWAEAYRDEHIQYIMESRNVSPVGHVRPSTPIYSKEYPRSRRFFVIKRKESNFKQVSAILIYKIILSMAGEIKSIKNSNKGNILVEIATPKQASQIVKIENFVEHEVIAAAHFTLNQTKGVVSEAELQNDGEEEILKFLEDKNANGVSRKK